MGLRKRKANRIGRATKDRACGKLLFRGSSGCGRRRAKGRPLGPGYTRNSQQEVLHLWCEFAPLCFLLREAIDPIQKRQKEAGNHKLIEVRILIHALLVAAQDCGTQAHERLKPQPRCDL